MNIIVLDKTGTLTEENLEIHCFLIILPKKEQSGPEEIAPSIEFDDLTFYTVIIKNVDKHFWKIFSENPDNQISPNSKINPLNNSIYFVE